MGLQRIAWPDGKSYLSQENLVVNMFDIIQAEIGEIKRDG